MTLMAPGSSASRRFAPFLCIFFQFFGKKSTRKGMAPGSSASRRFGFLYIFLKKMEPGVEVIYSKKWSPASNRLLPFSCIFDVLLLFLELDLYRKGEVMQVGELLGTLGTFSSVKLSM